MQAVSNALGAGIIKFVNGLDRDAWHEKVAVVESTRQDPGPGRVRISGAMHGPKPKETSSAGLFAVSQSDLGFLLHVNAKKFCVTILPI